MTIELTSENFIQHYIIYASVITCTSPIRYTSLTTHATLLDIYKLTFENFYARLYDIYIKNNLYITMNIYITNNIYITHNTYKAVGHIQVDC